MCIFCPFLPRSRVSKALQGRHHVEQRNAGLVPSSALESLPHRTRPLTLRLQATRHKVTPSGRVKVQQPAKEADRSLSTPEHKAWREAVLGRAGYRCEWVDGNGERCLKGSPTHRLFADHIRERRDGGAPLDPANGRCLCGSHHTLKTSNERSKRYGVVSGHQTYPR